MKTKLNLVIELLVSNKDIDFLIITIKWQFKNINKQKKTKQHLHLISFNAT